MTSIGAQITLLQLVYGQPEMAFVALLLDGHFILRSTDVDRLVCLAKGPIVEWQGVGLDMTVQRYVRSKGGTAKARECID